MKRDMDLMREILLAVEKQGRKGVDWPKEKRIEDYDDFEIGFHIKLLHDAGLLKAKERAIDDWKIYHLTNPGYDFLEVIRSKNKWDKIKKKVTKLGGEINLSTIMQAAQLIQSQASS